MRRGRCNANLLVFEDTDGTVRHDSGYLGYSRCHHGGVCWQAQRSDSEPTTGCHANPATGRCNRCGREV